MKQLVHDDPVIERINAIVKDCREQLQQLVGGKIIVSWKQEGGSLNNDIQVLKEIISDVTQMPWEMIACKKRLRDLVYPRNVFCWFAYKRIGKTYAFIGGVLNRDHTTIINSIEQSEYLLHVKDDLYYPLFKEVQARYNEHIQTKTEVANETAPN